MPNLQCITDEEALKIIELQDYVNVVEQDGWNNTLHLIHSNHPSCISSIIIKQLKYAHQTKSTSDF